MNHRASRRIALLLLVLSTACQYDPFAHEFTNVKPTDEDLIGQYELDDESIEMLRQHDLRPSSRFALQRHARIRAFDGLQGLSRRTRESMER